MSERARISFDGWAVDLSSGELSRDGHMQRLPPQPLAMLAELLARPGEVVSRDQLVKVLWPKGIVDFDNSLNAVVRKLRVALHDDANAPRYIETLPRIGFRFVGTLDPPAWPEALPAQGAHRRSLAVRAAPIVVLAAALTAATGFWLFKRAQGPVLDTPGPSAVTVTRSTNERAYDLYLQARFDKSRRDIDGSDLAIANLEAALREDPYFADGWAVLAETWSGSGMTLKVPVSDAYSRSRKAALRALELDGRSSRGLSALGHILTHYDRDFAKADHDLTQALRLDERNAWAWHGLALLRAYQGRMPEAFEAIRRARELESTLPLFSYNYGMLLYQSRRYDEAIAHAKSLLASQPRFDQARSLLIRALVAQGDDKAALEQLALRQTDRLSISDGGLVFARLNRSDEVRAQIARLERMRQQGYGVSYDIAVIHAALGDRKSGCEALQAALVDHSLTLPWMRLDPRMDPLRSEPCFADVRKRLYGE